MKSEWTTIQNKCDTVCGVPHAPHFVVSDRFKGRDISRNSETITEPYIDEINLCSVIKPMFQTDESKLN